uniref:Ig-like domain-containing protein n=1 Tax=Salarias fasciatus TaxID=181472 RepID=A0A672G3I2_SALFA
LACWPRFHNTAEIPNIIYPFTSTCAVEGSTVTLPCSFTPLTSVTEGRKTIYRKIVRVVWCRNHLICHGPTPTVYDSEIQRTSRFQYLGDMETVCTLQIWNIQSYDGGTFRFRMEVNDTVGHFTNRTGVTVKVSDGVQMEISSSGNHSELRKGGAVTLRCSSHCTTHRLEVTWFRDGHALPESGPALQLSPLSAEHSGNYTCRLKAKARTTSQPFSLKVEGLEGANPALIAGVTCGVLLAGVALIVSLVFIRRWEEFLYRHQSTSNILTTPAEPPCFRFRVNVVTAVV